MSKCAECGKPLKTFQESKRKECDDCFAGQYETGAIADALTDNLPAIEELHEQHYRKK